MSERHREYMTIGEVVTRLSEEYSDLTISKVRFLEEEGLISPERTPGGYRTYTEADVGRLELILRLQRDHFLPLAVIREKLKDIDKGKVPIELRPALSGETMTLPLEEAQAVPVDKAPSVLGLPASYIRELAEYGLVRVQQGPDGDELRSEDVATAHTCWDLRRFGVEPRHLRMYETFADREAALFSQILMPAFKHKTPETRQKLVETLKELTETTGEVKRAMLHRALTQVFEDVT